jgi:hypothetical protein
MSKHTQGDWGFDDNGIYEVIGDKLMAINGDDGMKIAWIEEGPEQLADARLIAAAPDLLEACKTALTLLRGLCGSDELGDLYFAEAERVESVIDAAIAKAEGGAK